MPTTPPRPAFTARIPRGPLLVLVLLSVSEVLDAMRAAGKGATDSAIKRECLRRSLRKVDDREVRYTDVAGNLLQGVLPRTRHQVQGALLWSRIHEPSADEMKAILDSAEVSEDGDREVWTVTLPGGRHVTLIEQAGETVDQVLRRASQAGSSEAVQMLSVAVEGLRGSIIALDSKAPPELGGRAWDAVFSVKETLLLATVYGEMQTGGADLEALQEGIVPLAPSASGGSGA